MSALLIEQYYGAFNRGDADAMLALLTDDVLHEPSQGAARSGTEAFTDFLDHMNRCYREKVLDPVFLVGEGAERGAAEFMLEGVTWRATLACRLPHGNPTAYAWEPFSSFVRAGLHA